MKIPSLSIVALAAATTLHAAPQPDFRLPEENANTDRAGQTISPRDYRGFVSVYYFGHET